MGAAHVCPPGHLYVCPTAREVESSCHGGHDVCCDRPDLATVDALKEYERPNGSKA